MAEDKFSDYRPPGVTYEDTNPPYVCEYCGNTFREPHICLPYQVHSLGERLAELEAKFEAHRHGYRWELWSKQAPPAQP